MTAWASGTIVAVVAGALPPDDPRRDADTPGTTRSVVELRLPGAVGRLAGLGSGGIPDSAGGAQGQALAAVVEGFAAVVWFGWAQVSANSWLSTLLTLGSVAGFVLAVVAFVRAARAARAGSALRERAVRRRYVAVLAVEAAVAVLGIFVLAVTGLLEWSPVWVCAVLGVHLVALARVLGDRLLVVVGALLVVVAFVALLLAVLGVTAPATVAGAGAGLCLLLAGTASLFPVVHAVLPRY